jgi:hypothetical protein
MLLTRLRAANPSVLYTASTPALRLQQAGVLTRQHKPRRHDYPYQLPRRISRASGRRRDGDSVTRDEPARCAHHMHMHPCSVYAVYACSFVRVYCLAPVRTAVPVHDSCGATSPWWLASPTAAKPRRRCAAAVASPPRRARAPTVYIVNSGTAHGTSSEYSLAAASTSSGTLIESSWPRPPRRENASSSPSITY